MARPLLSHDGAPAGNEGRWVLLRAFTLLELLAVVVLIGVLAALVFAAAAGASERSRRAQAAAELAVLLQSLEGYRQQYGDYPASGPCPVIADAAAASDDGPGVLFNALVGRRGPAAQTVPILGRCFVRLSAHVLQTPALPEATATTQVANAFLDPWGQRYLYVYRAGPAWTSRAPMLWSPGPDGSSVCPENLAGWDGTRLPDHPANADNILPP